jgi:hypothetical protein
VDGADGKKICLLKHLEAESKNITGHDAAADEAWKKIVGKDGLALPAWAEERALREFLARGESLCGTEGHGLW